MEIRREHDGRRHPGRWIRWQVAHDLSSGDSEPRSFYLDIGADGIRWHPCSPNDVHAGWLADAVIDESFDHPLHACKGETEIQCSGSRRREEPPIGCGHQRNSSDNQKQVLTLANGPHDRKADLSLILGRSLSLVFAVRSFGPDLQRPAN